MHPQRPAGSRRRDDERRRCAAAQLGIGSLEGGASVAPNAAITSGAILIALLKVRIIFREFMEVRHAPALLCRLTDLWLVFTGVSLLGGHLAGTLFARG